MQATVELTEQEYKVLESHVKRVIMFDEIGFAKLTACDKILGRIYLAFVEMPNREVQMQAKLIPGEEKS